MGDARLIKVEPAGYPGLEHWDEKLCSEIVQIFISHGRGGICSLQFLYVDNGALVLSNIHGKSNGDKFNVVTLNYPSEYLTCIRIWSDKDGQGNISSIAFQTNVGAHGPFGRATNLGAHGPLGKATILGATGALGQPTNSDQEFCFGLGEERGFGGFHGTTYYQGGLLSSVGVYVKPITSLSACKRQASK